MGSLGGKAVLGESGLAQLHMQMNRGAIPKMGASRECCVGGGGMPVEEEDGESLEPRGPAAPSEF